MNPIRLLTSGGSLGSAERGMKKLEREVREDLVTLGRPVEILVTRRAAGAEHVAPFRNLGTGLAEKSQWEDTVREMLAAGPS